MSGMKNWAEVIRPLTDTARKWLFTWPQLSGKDRLKRGIRQYLLRQTSVPLDHWFWPNALLAEGLLAAGDVDTVQKYVDLWIEKQIPIYYVDNAANGPLLLELYERTGEEKYREAADRLAQYLRNCPCDTQGNLDYRRHNPGDVHVDTIGLVCPFLCRYGALFHDDELLRLGERQLLLFLENGMDARCGLCYHGFRYCGPEKINAGNEKSRSGDIRPSGIRKQGVIGWGRAMGWLLKGLAESLPYLPKEAENTRKLQKVYEHLISVCMEYQREDGSFAWMLPAMEGPADSSATAMIAGAIAQAAVKTAENNEGTVEKTGTAGDSVAAERSRKCVEHAVNFLASCVRDGMVLQCSAECVGYSEYPQRYGSYPWSVGPTLRLMAEMQK